FPFIMITPQNHSNLLACPKPKPTAIMSFISSTTRTTTRDRPHRRLALVQALQTHPTGQRTIWIKSLLLPSHLLTPVLSAIFQMVHHVRLYPDFLNSHKKPPDSYC